MASSLNPSNVGQFVTSAAKPQFGGTVTATVTFYDGAVALKTASLSGGVAKFTTFDRDLGRAPDHVKVHFEDCYGVTTWVVLPELGR